MVLHDDPGPQTALIDHASELQHLTGVGVECRGGIEVKGGLGIHTF
jgi:hypothetical protein